MKKYLLYLCGLLLCWGGSTLLQAQAYVGSESCSGCHPIEFNQWVDSGHPYKFTLIVDDQPPVYPPEAINFQSQWMDSLGNEMHTWADIAGVIGGYGWKARFVGTDGHLIGTAGSTFPDAGLGHNQINFYGGEFHGWVDYNPGNVKIYNYACFKCHTTGGTNTGSWLEGVMNLGDFSEGGIGCESCHGPGGDHVSGPSATNIDRVYEFNHLDNTVGGLSIDGVVQAPDPEGNDVNFLCGTCHNRSYTDPINASSGFIRHHEQWDEFVATKHYQGGYTCTSCHNPHKRVIWGGDGIIAECAGCHTDQAENLNHPAGLDCIDCHMPFASKSGTTRGQSGYKADVRSHLMKIIPDTASMFNEAGTAVRDDDTRSAALSPHFACLGCHNDDPNDAIADKTIEQAALTARDMHEPQSIFSPQQLALGLFPNPSKGHTSISFTLPSAEMVSFKIYNSNGQLIYTEAAQYRSAGDQMLHWNGSSNTGMNVSSGCYFIKITAGIVSSAQKLVLLK